MITSPPFDGQPCPMCPEDIRGLFATVRNLAWRLLSYEGECASVIVDRFRSLKESVARCHSLSEDSPMELKELLYAAGAACSAKTVGELIKFGPRLKSVSEAVEPLRDAHFADRKHSHGY